MESQISSCYFETERNSNRLKETSVPGLWDAAIWNLTIIYKRDADIICQYTQQNVSLSQAFPLISEEIQMLELKLTSFQQSKGFLRSKNMWKVPLETNYYSHQYKRETEKNHVNYKITCSENPH